MFPAAVLRLLAPWAERALTALRWLRHNARGRLRRLFSIRPLSTENQPAWYKDLYRSLGERALESGRPGDHMPELILYDLEGNDRQLSRSWARQPALLVTMSLTCGQSRRHARALQQLARRFQPHINTVIIYVKDAHPVDAPSPYTDKVWVTAKNEIAGIRCAQPRTLAERIQLAHQLRLRFHLTPPILVDALDDRAWVVFGRTPNVATLVDLDGRIVVRQGWFEPREMARVITALLQK